jgi:hypothetical protein
LLLLQIFVPVERKLKFNQKHFLEGRFLATAKVARWFVFKPKIPIWVIFGGP